jgi:hypothetical protein
VRARLENFQFARRQPLSGEKPGRLRGRSSLAGGGQYADGRRGPQIPDARRNPRPQSDASPNRGAVRGGPDGSKRFVLPFEIYRAMGSVARPTPPIPKPIIMHGRLRHGDTRLAHDTVRSEIRADHRTPQPASAFVAGFSPSLPSLFLEVGRGETGKGREGNFKPGNRLVDGGGMSGFRSLRGERLKAAYVALNAGNAHGVRFMSEKAMRKALRRARDRDPEEKGPARWCPAGAVGSRQIARHPRTRRVNRAPVR